MTRRPLLAFAAIVLAAAVHADSGSEKPVARTYAAQVLAPER